MNYLYHYTSIETLALILKNRTLCFNNLLHVDDLEEAQTKDLGQFGKYLNVSCWTQNDEESLPMWSMYTQNMHGVRLKMKLFPFKKYHFESGQFFLEDDVDTYINLQQMYEDNEGSITADQPKLREIQYCDDEELLFPTVRGGGSEGKKMVQKFMNAPSLKEAGRADVVYSFEEIGTYKRTIWHFQQEWRYVITSSPMGLKEQSKTTFGMQQEYVRRLEDVNQKAPYDRIFLELADDAFEGAEILLGPRMTEAEEIMIEALVNMYCSEVEVKKSSIKVKG